MNPDVSRLSWLLLSLTLLASCSLPSPPYSPPPSSSSADAATDSRTERSLTMTLFVKSQDGRYTYYEISEENELSYAGGRMAAQRVARPIGQLPHDIRTRIMQLIESHGLMQIDSPHLFLPDGQVSYDLFLKIDGQSHRILAADHQVAGLKEMSEMLFRTQFAKKYAQTPHPKENPPTDSPLDAPP